MFGVPISGDLGISVNKSGTVVLTTTDFHVVDPNYTAGQLTFTVSNPTNGHVSFAANPGIAITSFTEADLEAGNVLFVHDGSNTTQATFKVSVSDGVTSSAVTTIIASVPTVTISVLSANVDFNNSDLVGPMGAGQIQPTLTPATQITIINTAANRKFVFDGVGLTLDNNSNPAAITGGTITAIHAFTNDLTPVALFDLIGTLDAVVWYDAIVADAAGNQSPINSLTSGWSFNFVGGAWSDAWSGGDVNDSFKSSGGNDLFDGQFGYDRANYSAAPGAINVQLADGTVTKYTGAIGTVVDSTDTLRSIEFVTGTNFADIFNAGATTNNPQGFNSNSTNAGSAVTFNVNGTSNEFEGRGGNDTITGNGNTRISYLHATAGVTVTFTSWVSGQALPERPGDASVGTIHSPASTVYVVRISTMSLMAAIMTPILSKTSKVAVATITSTAVVALTGRCITNEDSGINVHMAAGKVVGGPNTGTDTLRSIEAIIGTEFADTYTAAIDTDPVYGSAFAFGVAGAANIGSNGTLQRI